MPPKRRRKVTESTGEGRADKARSNVKARDEENSSSEHGLITVNQPWKGGVIRVGWFLLEQRDEKIEAPSHRDVTGLFISPILVVHPTVCSVGSKESRYWLSTQVTRRFDRETKVRFLPILSLFPSS